MGREYLKFYQLLHAVERPVDLTEIEKVLSSHQTPFKNTTDLFKQNPGLIWQLKGRKNKSEFFNNLNSKEEEDKKQPGEEV